jgi:TolB-like protein/Tfp pilus assembly protein PilF
VNFFNELKRRNVFRVAAAYAIISWLLLQVGETLAPALRLPDWVNSTLAFFLILGFPLAIFFAWAFELTPEGIKKEKDVDRAQSITHHTGRKLDRTIIVVLALALGYFIWESRFSPEKGPDTFSPEDAQSMDVADGEKMYPAPFQDEDTAATPPSKSIAVLPFVNMSDDAANEFFSDGISEEILNALAKVKDLKVAGRTSSFAFKGQNQDLREIGAALRVAHILEGSVRKAGNRVRVTAQLIKVDDGYHVWSENYDRELDDVFAIQDEISAAILQELKAHLVGEETATAARTDTRAYELYLLATQRIYERNQASLQMAEELLTEAISIDPGYAPAYAQLGIATLLLADSSYGSIPSEEAASKGRQHLEKALELDPRNPDALAGMGLYHFDFKLDYPAAFEVLEQAVAINPNLINARTWLSTAYGETGNLRQAMQILEDSYALDPLHPASYNNLAQGYAVMGQPEQAMKVLADLERYIPNDAGRAATEGKVLVMTGRWAQSDRKLTGAIEKEPLNYVDRAWLSVVLLGLAQYGRAAEIGAEPQRAVALSRLGRIEEALILGHETASRGIDVRWYFQILVENGRHVDLVSFFESHWPDLDAYLEEWPADDGFGAPDLGLIAEAYSRMGNEDKFNEAMSRFEASLDAQLAQGADNWVLTWSRAHHALLAGDPEGAIDLLDKAVTQGAIVDDGLTASWGMFSSLRGDPAFEAVKERMLEYLNEERAELGLEPVTT